MTIVPVTAPVWTPGVPVVSGVTEAASAVAPAGSVAAGETDVSGVTLTDVASGEAAISVAVGARVAVGGTGVAVGGTEVDVRVGVGAVYPGGGVTSSASEQAVRPIKTRAVRRMVRIFMRFLV
jgi:hypothetical protein